MTRLAVMLALALVVGIAVVALQRRTTRPQVATRHHLPSHVDRGRFASPTTPWLISIFSSATCLACAEVIGWARSLESDSVVVQDIEVDAEPELHHMHRIDSVPSTVIADHQGVVKLGLVGPLSPADKAQITAIVGAHSPSE